MASPSASFPVPDGDAPHLYPSTSEFASFSSYVLKAENRYGASTGMVIVHPPAGWAPRGDLSYADIRDITVSRPIRQQVVGGRGIFFEVLVEQRSRSVDEFRADCTKYDATYLTAPPEPLEDGEQGVAGVFPGPRMAKAAAAREAAAAASAVGGRSATAAVATETAESSAVEGRGVLATVCEVGSDDAAPAQTGSADAEDDSGDTAALEAEQPYLPAECLPSPDNSGLNGASAESRTASAARERRVACDTGGMTLREVERLYWRGVPTRMPTYGADSPGSLFEQPLAGMWDLSRLPTILRAVPYSIPGVTTPFLYFGTFGATFAWHTEDADLHGINYIHAGSPKTWYAIPPADRPRFERLAANMYAGHAGGCRQFLRHKQCLLTPEFLARHGVDVVRATHPAGTFAVVFAGVYHAGFNHGWNVAESVNFGSVSWLRGVGRAAVACRCRADSVSLDLDALEAIVWPVLGRRGKGGKRRKAIGAVSSAAGASDDDGDANGDGSGGSGSMGARRPSGGGPPRRRRPPPPPPLSTADDAADIRELAAEMADLQRMLAGFHALAAAAIEGGGGVPWPVGPVPPPPPNRLQRGEGAPPLGAGGPPSPSATVPEVTDGCAANGAAAADTDGNAAAPSTLGSARGPSTPPPLAGSSPNTAKADGVPPTSGSPVSIASAGSPTADPPSYGAAAALFPAVDDVVDGGDGETARERPSLATCEALRERAAANLLRLSTLVSRLETAILARRPASRRARPRGLPALGDVAVARLARASRVAILSAKRPPRPSAADGAGGDGCGTSAGGDDSGAVRMLPRPPPARRLESMTAYSVPLGGNLSGDWDAEDAYDADPVLAAAHTALAALVDGLADLRWALASVRRLTVVPTTTGEGGSVYDAALTAAMDAKVAAVVAVPGDAATPAPAAVSDVTVGSGMVSATAGVAATAGFNAMVAAAATAATAAVAHAAAGARAGAAAAAGGPSPVCARVAAPAAGIGGGSGAPAACSVASGVAAPVVSAGTSANPAIPGASPALSVATPPRAPATSAPTGGSGGSPPRPPSRPRPTTTLVAARRHASSTGAANRLSRRLMGWQAALFFRTPPTPALAPPGRRRGGAGVEAGSRKRPRQASVAVTALAGRGGDAGATTTVGGGGGGAATGRLPPPPRRLLPPPGRGSTGVPPSSRGALALARGGGAGGVKAAALSTMATVANAAASERPPLSDQGVVVPPTACWPGVTTAVPRLTPSKRPLSVAAMPSGSGLAWPTAVAPPPPPARRLVGAAAAAVAAAARRREAAAAAAVAVASAARVAEKGAPAPTPSPARAIVPLLQAYPQRPLPPPHRGLPTAAATLPHVALAAMPQVQRAAPVGWGQAPPPPPSRRPITAVPPVAVLVANQVRPAEPPRAVAPPPQPPPAGRVALSAGSPSPAAGLSGQSALTPSPSPPPEWRGPPVAAGRPLLASPRGWPTPPPPPPPPRPAAAAVAAGPVADVTPGPAAHPVVPQVVAVPPLAPMSPKATPPPLASPPSATSSALTPSSVPTPAVPSPSVQLTVRL